MCGIYGIFEPRRPVERALLEQQRDLLSHRGPDDRGSWLSSCGRVGLAHRRLSIIELSALGHQPMVDSDGRLAVTFNGEIFNFRALRVELQSAGHAFHGHSDTEVLLAAYRQWGEACLERLNGMFAFTIYDAGTLGAGASLFFARDRAGEKPFFYRHSGGSFEFASELKAISGRGGLDLQATDHYLALGYVPGGLCLAENARKLPPGHAGVLDLGTGALRLWRYWALPRNEANIGAEPDALAEEAMSLLADSVRLRLESDVPLAVLLSGGLDSSLVAALAARQSSAPVKTFNVSFPGSPFDESRHAELVARHFGTEHHCIEMARPSIGLIDEVARYIDEPIGDSSLLPAFALAREMRRAVTVGLGGDGGDELFGGYSDYAQALADQARLRAMPAALLRGLAALAGRLPAGVRGRNRIGALREGALRQIVWGSPYFDVALRRRLLRRESLAQIGSRIDAPEISLQQLFEQGSGPVDSMTRVHFGSILPDDFLVKVDRASMAHGVEIRCPFLDHRLIEFCFAKVPDDWKVLARDTRRLEKRMAARLLPPALDVERKQGFSIPLDEWMRAMDAGAFMDRVSPLFRRIDESEVRRLLAGLHGGRANGARLFSLMTLAIAFTNLGLQ